MNLEFKISPHDFTSFSHPFRKKNHQAVVLNTTHSSSAIVPPDLGGRFLRPGHTGKCRRRCRRAWKVTHKVSNMIQLKFEDLVEDYLNLFQNSSTYI